MNELIALIYSESFVVNLASGFVIFAIETALLIILIPLVLERRQNKRWLPVRKNIIREVCKGASHLTSTLARDPNIKESNIEMLKRTVDELGKIGTNTRHQLELYKPAMTPTMLISIEKILTCLERIAASLNASLSVLVVSISVGDSAEITILDNLESDYKELIDELCIQLKQYSIEHKHSQREIVVKDAFINVSLAEKTEFLPLVANFFKLS